MCFSPLSDPTVRRRGRAEAVKLPVNPILFRLLRIGKLARAVRRFGLWPFQERRRFVFSSEVEGMNWRSVEGIEGMKLLC